MEDLNIPKLKKEVEIAFKDAGVIKKSNMILFLNKFSARHSGEETVLEILNDSSQFIPAMMKNGNEKFAILNIDSIFYVSELETAHDEIEGKDELNIQFITGEQMNFFIHEVLPGNRSRAIDFLNSGNNFLTFMKDGRTVYVNKHKINKAEII